MSVADPAAASTGVHVHGLGAVSPAGWGVPALRAALKGRVELAATDLPRPGGPALRLRRVPALPTRPPWLAHPRLRRSSVITQFAVGAALEAIGDDRAAVGSGAVQLGVVLCVMTGCVHYSQRFYDETLRDPATASPLLFPETVFNAPASHLAAVLGTRGLNYTLVGDPSAFLAGLALGAQWLEEGSADAVVVIGAEEGDWPVAEAVRLFSRRTVPAEGAGAIYLRREPKSGGAKLTALTDLHEYRDRVSQAQALQRARDELKFGAGELLCDGTQGVEALDAVELAAWQDWSGGRLAPKRIFGEGLMAAAAWQCVAAIDAVALGLYPAACVSIPGSNHAAGVARFARGWHEALASAG